VQAAFVNAVNLIHLVRTEMVTKGKTRVPILRKTYLSNEFFYDSEPVFFYLDFKQHGGRVKSTFMFPFDADKTNYFYSQAYKVFYERYYYYY
jgi:hypothetical protein